MLLRLRGKERRSSYGPAWCTKTPKATVHRAHTDIPRSQYAYERFEAHTSWSVTAPCSLLYRKEAIQKTIMAMTLGKDVSALFPDVLKNIATADLDQKKLVYLYLMFAISASESEGNLLNEWQELCEITPRPLYSSGQHLCPGLRRSQSAYTGPCDKNYGLHQSG